LLVKSITIQHSHNKVFVSENGCTLHILYVKEVLNEIFNVNSSKVVYTHELQKLL